MSQVVRWLSGTTKSHEDMGYARFNSGLTFGQASTSTNAELTIWLRMLFKPSMVPYHQKEVDVDYHDGIKRKVGIRHWKADKEDPNEFERFVKAVKSEAEVVWDQTGLCLIPPKDYRGLYWPEKRPTHQLNINCRFQLISVNEAADAHNVVQCTRIDEHSSGQIISNMDPKTRTGKFDSGDVPAALLSKNPVSVSSAGYTGHLNTIPHEIGHAIGLPHIGVLTNYSACLQAAKANPSVGTSVTQCYEGPGADDKDNIMGSGRKITLLNCLPWFWRAMAHCPDTHVKDWRVRLGKVPPRPL